MKTNIDCIQEFFRLNHEKLYERLREGLLPEKDAEKIVYALYCIGEQIEKIYCKQIPLMIANNVTKAEMEDLFEEIKFSCNEIRQLIETSNLTDLRYWDDKD